jgi:hypothetical protein
MPVSEGPSILGNPFSASIRGDFMSVFIHTLPRRPRIDFAVTKSMFSHCSTSLIRNWLVDASRDLKDDGALFATFLVADEDYAGDEGWICPGCVRFRPDTMKALTQEADLGFKIPDWKHPRQNWAVFSNSQFNNALISGGNIGWNRMLEARR